MFKWLISFTTLVSLSAFSSLFANSDDCCCQCAQVSVGWRRDQLDWKMHHLDSSHIRGHVNSRIHFRDINSYTLSGKAKWAGSCYYVRFSAEYGSTYKGRAHETFQIRSPHLYYPIEVMTSDRIKRRSEVYDFNIAAGYPLSFFCSRLSVIPLIGFSFHRQHIRVKEPKHHSYTSSSSSSSHSHLTSSSFTPTYSEYYYPHSSSEFFAFHSSSDFYLCSSNPFRYSPYSNPFSSSSDSTIASVLGLSNPHRTDMYRFTWYGFYLGADIAYALDSSWTLFSELEAHFLDNCHRKRKSWTGVYFVDGHHKKGWAYGFNGVVGLTYAFATCWYTTIDVDFRWWESNEKHDELEWKMVGAKIGLGYMF